MVDIIKASGKIEPFNEQKLRESIRRAGISKNIESLVAQHVKSKLYENIPTSEIYNHIIEFLGKSEIPHYKSKYSLKQAIMDLGPTGYPFEDFFAKIMETEAFKTETRKALQGKAIAHEIDILSEKENLRIIVECKFHNNPGTKTDSQVALFTKSRFDDVKELNNLNQAWIVTNTKITKDAIDYALYYGLKAISWNFPEKESLRDLIERTASFPITILSALSSGQKQRLLEKHIVLCRDLISDQKNLIFLNLPEEKQRDVLEEAKFITGV